MSGNSILQLVLMIVPLLFAVTIHEAAHGYVADRMGDPTAKMMGRVTLNPVRHLDPFGSLLLPLILKLSGSPFIFGYAKPVPVNSNNFYDYRMGTILVASAGVVSNLICAGLSGLLFQVMLRFEGLWQGSFAETLVTPVADILAFSVIINLVLAIFNLIPVPPLDGSRILAMLLPPHLRVPYVSIERYGMIILVILLMSGVVNNIISLFVFPLSKFLLGM